MGESGESEETVLMVSIVENVKSFGFVECTSVLELEIVVCVCLLVSSAGLEDGIDGVNAEALRLSVVENAEDIEVKVLDIIFVTVGPFSVEDNVVSHVEPLLLVDDSNVVVLIEDIAVVNVD